MKNTGYKKVKNRCVSFIKSKRKLYQKQDVSLQTATALFIGKWPKSKLCLLYDLVSQKLLILNNAEEKLGLKVMGEDVAIHVLCCKAKFYQSTGDTRLLWKITK